MRVTQKMKNILGWYDVGYQELNFGIDPGKA
jgi:hypothetical protein